jgi:glycosyltransferase involved in cell wall biosynthesis
MKIGIDAKWYFEGPPSGKRVVVNLVDQMILDYPENEYYIFLDRRAEKLKFRWDAKPNVKCIYVWADNNFLSNVFLLPLYSKKFNLQALLYQNFISPFDASKTIAYIHDVLFLSNPEFYTIYERLYFSPLKFLTRRADMIITVSEEEKKRLLKFRFADDHGKIMVAHHGVDNTFAPKEKISAAILADVKKKFQLPDQFLLYVGRLNLRKNIDNLLKAIPLLRNTSIPLVIVGADNWKSSNHEHIIQSLGIQNRIHFTGAIYQDLGVVYALAHVFCFPSYAESFGLPPLEAMASGVAVVVSNTTSLPEVCGEAGTYVNPHQPEEIALRIDELLDDPKLYARKRKLGFEQASRFTWKNAAKTILNAIDTVVQ